jgi:hypothetical protein
MSIEQSISPQGEMPQDELLKATKLALDYAARGVPAFPVGISIGTEPRRTGKRPLNDNGHKGASVDADEVRRQFADAPRRLRQGEVLGVGLHLGPAGLFAVDVDLGNGKHGDEELLALANQRPLPETVRALTPSGGWHDYYAKPLGRHIGNHPLCRHVDIRGDDGWVVAPGTTTPWGSWEPEDDGLLDGAQPAPAPAWLLDELAPPTNGTPPPPGTGHWHQVDEAALCEPDRAALAAVRRLGGHNEHLRGETLYVTRPGKASDTSATIGHIGPGVVKVFSTDWPGLPLGTYSADQLREIAEDEADPLAAWHPVELGPILAGDLQPPQPTVLPIEGTGAKCLFYSGSVNGLHGDSGIGKSWVVLVAAARELEEGRCVMMLDYEANAIEVCARLRALAMPAHAIQYRLLYFNVDAPVTPVALEHLISLVNQRKVSLVAIDSIGEAFGVEGVNEDKDAEVGPWLRRVARRLAEAGPAVVIVDHGTKAADNPLYASGSKRKRAAITGASYLVSSTIPPTREQAGRIYLKCAKDRHGNFRRDDTAAVLDIEPWPDGGITAHMLQPTETEQAAGKKGSANFDVVVRALVRAARKIGRPVGVNELLDGANVRARRATLIEAVDKAVADGYLSEQAGPRRARLLSFVEDPGGD